MRKTAPVPNAFRMDADADAYGDGNGIAIAIAIPIGNRIAMKQIEQGEIGKGSVACLGCLAQHLHQKLKAL